MPGVLAGSPLERGYTPIGAARLRTQTRRRKSWNTDQLAKDEDDDAIPHAAPAVISSILFAGDYQMVYGETRAPDTAGLRSATKCHIPTPLFDTSPVYNERKNGDFISEARIGYGGDGASSRPGGRRTDCSHGAGRRGRSRWPACRCLRLPRPDSSVESVPWLLGR